MCLQLDWIDLESYSRKRPETLLGGPFLFQTSLKIWISCVAKVKLQIKVKIKEKKNSGEDEQSFWNDEKHGSGLTGRA